MEILQLRYFVEIARHESITQAAQRLFVSQPSLSQSVRRLEKELGTELFRHEGRNIRLTEQGRRFFLRAERALRELDTACSEIDGQALQGHITIGTYMPLSPILECLRAFSKQYPYITIDIYLVSAGLSSFDPGSLDALLYYAQSNHLDFHEQIRIGAVERRFVVPAEHPITSRDMLSMSDLESACFVSMMWGAGGQEELFQDYSHAGIAPHIRYRTNSVQIKNELMGAGMAVGSSNDLLCRSLSGCPECVVVRQKGTAEELFLGWRAECYRSPAAQAFALFCQTWFSEPEHHYHPQ